jgi:hypothetical protein
MCHRQLHPIEIWTRHQETVFFWTHRGVFGPRLQRSELLFGDVCFLLAGDLLFL